jgi:uncharacterized protein YjbJ (UPF0337 family)
MRRSGSGFGRGRSTVAPVQSGGNTLSFEQGMEMGKKDKAKNRAQIAKGKVKATVGKAAGDDQLKNEGDADQMKGNLKQAGEKVKDAFKE